jgi:hypothetical protein
MNSVTGTPTETTRLSARNKVGLVLCGLLGLGDVVGMATVGQQAPGGGAAPPTVVLIAAGVLGIITVAAVVHTWRTRSRVGSRITAGSRILSALTAVPAFFVDGVSGGLVAVAGVGIVLTLVAVWLVLAPTGTD